MVTSRVGEVFTYLGGIGLAMPAASFCSSSENFSQPSAMVARSRERMMPDTIGIS
jgi:hypothetical protein